MPERFALASVLRAIGAVSFVGAGASFLVEGWTDPGVLKRQLLWAVGTLSMTAFGIVAVRRWRDAVGARLFLGLAAATVPAHFAQLGAATYALRRDGIGSLGAVLGAAVILLLLLPPLALGVGALVRRRGVLLTSLMFALSLPLALPGRDPAVVAFIGVAEVIVWLLLEATLFRRDALFDSVEGMAARLMLAAPALIVLVRNAFYPSTDLFVAAALASPSLVLLVWPWLRSIDGKRAAAAKVTGVIGLILATALALRGPVAMLLTLGIVLLLGAEAIGRRGGAFAWVGAGCLAAAALASYADAGVVSAVALVPVGALHAVAAFRRRSATRVVVTAAVTVIGAVGHLVHLVHFPRHELWIPAVLVSVSLLVLASLVESRRADVERVTRRLARHFAADATETRRAPVTSSPASDAQCTGVPTDEPKSMHISPV